MSVILKAARYLLSLIMSLVFAIPAYAEVVLDGTLGTKGTISGPNFNITATMGQTYGSNLFHSFSTFNLNNTESAIFTGPSTVTNIISRVTGGQASSIDGTIQSSITGADFWFINPSGIVFGQNAKLDVGGSFHASTADYIKLSDNNRFDATNPATPILTSAPPSAFGFLSSNPTGITLKDGAFLKVSEGMTLSLVGGNLDIQNSNLYASAGTINLISVASAGEAVVDKQNFNVDSFSKFGEINIKDTMTKSEKPEYDFMHRSKMGIIDTSGTGGGKIFIRGGKFFIGNGYIYADTYGEINSPGIDIRATDSISVSGVGAGITSKTLGKGNAGSINIYTAKLNISDGVYIATNAMEGSGGDGGNITIKATDSIDISGHYAVTGELYAIAISSQTWGKGKAGSISVNTLILNLSDGGEISAKSTGSGNAGDIDIKASDTIQLVGSSITTAADSAGGGHINLTAGRMINLINSETTATVAGGTSSGGNITATAPFLILNQSNIIAKADEGKGGNINLKTDIYIRTLDSEVSASSRRSIDGTVVTSSPAIDLSGKVALVQAAYTDTGALAPKQCVEREEELSSFSVKGRDGLPPFPDSLLAIP